MTFRWFSLGAIAIVSILVMLGCSNPAPTGSVNRQGVAPGQGAGQTSPQAGGANTSKDGVWTAKAGETQVTLKLTPFPPGGRSVSTFDITLADNSGRPISDAQVDLELTMPAMPMPPNKPKAQSSGDGRYTASSRMGMRGEWKIAVTIRRNGQTQTVNFTTEVP